MCLAGFPVLGELYSVYNMIVNYMYISVSQGSSDLDLIFMNY